ncbi:MAG: dienelactone hydrolase family protein [Pseudomonadota bacterium]
MCDDRTVQESERYLKQRRGLTRRDFGRLTAGAALGMMLPPLANAQQTTGSDVMIETPDGEADAYFVRPSSGSHPGVLIWPDILGLRPAFRQMGLRLAEAGYSVLVVNPFYRDARAPVVGEGASFQDEETRQIVLPMARALNEDTHMSDARAFIHWMDRRGEVDPNRPMGTMGYCMGGPMIMRTAAAAPERIGAAASFHGGGLVTTNADSPHRLIPHMNADFLIAVADNDDENDPQAKHVLRDEFEQAGLSAEVEVYEGAMHGWCVPDSAVYHEEQAERAWSRLLALFNGALR